jgi:hypothetical protein
MYCKYPVTAKKILKLPTKGTNTAECMALLLAFWHHSSDDGITKSQQ